MPTIQEQKKTLVEEMMRENIREAAVAVIREHGWRGTTMSKIAAAAGVSKGTLYNYFEGKLDMLAFVGEHSGEELFRQMKALQKTDMSPWAKVEKLLRIMLNHTVNNLRITACFMDAHMNDPDVRDYLHHHMQECSPWKFFSSFMEEEIARGIEKGVFRQVQPIAAAAIFQHSFFLLTKILSEKEKKDITHINLEDVSREEILSTFNTIYLQGLLTESAAKEEITP